MKRNLTTFDKVFFISVIVVFVIIALVDFLNKSQWFWDSLVAFAGLYLAYDLYIYKKLSLPAIFLGVLHLIVHTMNLYGLQIFTTGYNFDTIIHAFGGFAGAVIFFQLIKNNLKGHYFKTAIFTITFMAVMGAGAIVEIVEYGGKIFLGEGDGLFFYGLGDYGDWGNAIQDMLFNGIGALFFITILMMDNGEFYNKIFEH
ncbi:MAG: hypothetical protein QW331_01060 [Candidatus Woesearchaeota archaeon]